MGELPFLCEWANCHSPLQMPYRLICGRKGTAFFQTSKFFVNFFYDFFNLFFKWLRMRRIFFEEKLGETQRNSEGGDGPRTPEGGLAGKGVRDARAGRGWE